MPNNPPSKTWEEKIREDYTGILSLEAIEQSIIYWSEFWKNEEKKVRADERAKVCDQILQSASGGGNWRRIIEQIKSKGL